MQTTSSPSRKLGIFFSKKMEAEGSGPRNIRCMKRIGIWSQGIKWKSAYRLVGLRNHNELPFSFLMPLIGMCSQRITRLLRKTSKMRGQTKETRQRAKGRKLGWTAKRVLISMIECCIFKRTGCYFENLSTRNNL